jgi:hypothetical protein
MTKPNMHNGEVMALQARIDADAIKIKAAEAMAELVRDFRSGSRLRKRELSDAIDAWDKANGGERIAVALEGIYPLQPQDKP